MLNLGLGIVIALMIFGLIQLVYVTGFFFALRRRPWKPLSDEACPKVAILLPLRGADPFLENCVAGLLNQDYPDYRLHVIVDSESDPAWQLIHQIVGEHPRSHLANIAALKDRLETCGLRNSSLLQFEASLDDSCEVIAIVDADVVAHRTWLRELVAPLQDERYGASSGNRWYMPEKPTWGSLVRYVWNAGAVVQMYWNNYAWGGSVAARRSSITQVEKNEGWRRAIVSLDTSIHKEMRRQGKRAAFVPTLLMTNREDCDLRGFYPWVQRQLLLSRLYSPQWPIVIGHGLLTTVLLALGIGICVAAGFSGHMGSCLVVLAGLLVYLVLMLVCVAILELGARSVIAERGEKTGWLNWFVLVKMTAALPLTQVVYTAALIRAATMQRVSWRGINYRVKGPYEITMEEYKPYVDGCSVMGKDALSSL